MILFSARGSLWEATMEHARSSNHGAVQRIAAHNILAANSMFQQKEVFSDMETSRTYLTGNRSGGRGGGSKGGSSRNLSLYPKGGQEVRQREESRSKSVDFLKETSNRAHSLSPSRSPHRTPFVPMAQRLKIRENEEFHLRELRASDNWRESRIQSLAHRSEQIGNEMRTKWAGKSFSPS
eukprot:CAMPEP_0173093452 /NCGR_PEP_ID=MMETSP1102-20130122/30077_1 /TAXON_ID=49646 /ORGANISM="Geminigera sp., Strain Caron Lab Isolate" /LENGTH=179 /DNA_ID=CAMNT_0013981627 /DNA_START=14 /DNA_END=549 /DNA_ORIENTATION=+